MDDITIHFPPGEHFACTDCGKCCSISWRVKVEKGEADVIRATESYRALERQGFVPLKVLEDGFELNRRENLDCYFLSDGLCAIHREVGPLAKPSVCQLYPFALVATPDGYFASMMFTCPAVISGSGPLAEEQSESLKLTMRAAPQFFPPDLVPGDAVTLVKGVKLGWKDYLNFEGDIIGSVEREDDTTAVLLKAASVTQAAALTRVRPSMAPEEPFLADGILEQAVELLSIFVIHTIASFEERDEPEKRQEYAERLVADATVHSPILGCDVPTYSGGRRGDQLTRGVLKRYVTHKLWGKNLITGPTLAIRLLLLAVCVELFHHYHEGLKASTSTLHFDQNLVERCFDLIETDIMLHDELVLPLIEEWERIGMSYAQDLLCSLDQS